LKDRVNIIAVVNLLYLKLFQY